MGCVYWKTFCLGMRLSPLVGLVMGAGAWATDIEGVQSAALDQPRVYLNVRRAVRDAPLSAAAGDNALGKMLGLDQGGQAQKTIAITAFLDTGASNIVLSKSTAQAMGIKAEQVTTAAGQRPVVFYDVGVGGSDEFHVAEPLLFCVAPYHPQTATESADAYISAGGLIRAQIGPLNGGGLLGALTDLDVLGMPALQGKVVVIDARPVNTFGDTLRTYIYPAGSRFNAAREKQDPGIPPTDRHVVLSYVDFAPFTRVEPAGSQAPTGAANPFIGPNPFVGTGRKIPPAVAVHRGKSTPGSWLLDTGAAASMISKRQAAAIGITYRAGTEGTISPVLDGVEAERQFALTVGGIGGSKKSAGFMMDELRIPTREGDVLVYKGAPVLVMDITVTDPRTKKSYTLDGVFGMNFLVGSAAVTEGILLPDIGKMSEGAYEWIVFDQGNGVLGLKLRR